MSKINPVKVRQDADKLEKAGKLEPAIALYRQIVDDNPRDWNTINKIGDLFAKLNRLKEASAEYAKVADFYARDGFLLKAIAIWKKINKLDPTILDPYLNLADLYGKQGLMMEAKGQYQYVVDEFVKRGRMREAGDVLKKMAEIDPSDLKVRSRLADLYTREGNAAKAVEEHVAIAEELNKKGHLAEAVQVLEKGLKIDPKSHRLRLELGRVYLVQKNHERAAQYLEEAVQGSPNDPKILVRLGEAYVGAKKIEEAEAIFKRLLEIDPTDQESRVQMARVYLLQGQFDRAFEGFQPIVDKLVERREGEKAAAFLQQILQKNPNHIRTLQKMIDIYRGLQKDQIVVQMYSQLTEAFIKHNQPEQAASVLEILVSMEPQNQQHKTKLQFVRSKQSGAPAASIAPPPAAARGGGGVEMEEEFDLAEVPETSAAAPLRGPGRPAPAPAAGAASGTPGRPTIELSGTLSADDKEFIEEHLAEGRVFRKYGLVDKAADQFEAIVARFADNMDARQELRDLYKEKGQAGKAAEQALALAEISKLKGDGKGAIAYEDEARALVPALAPAAPKPAAAPAAAPARAAAPAPAPRPEPALEDDSEEITIGQNDEEVLLEVEESGLESPSLSLGGDSGGALLGEDIASSGELLDSFVEEEELSLPAAEEPHEDIDIPVEEETVPEPEPEPEPTFAGAAEEESALAGLPGLAGMEEGPGLTLDVEEDLSLGGLDLAAPAPAPPPVAKAKAKAPEPAPAPKPRPEPPPPAAKPKVEPPKPVPAPMVARAKPAPAPPPPPKTPGLPPELQRILDEVDSYIAVGFVDDAREALRDARGRFGSNPALIAKLNELGVTDEPTPAPAPAPAPAPVRAKAKPEPPKPEPPPRIEPPKPPKVELPPPPPPEPEPEPEPEFEPVSTHGLDGGLDLDLPAVEETFPAPPPPSRGRPAPAPPPPPPASDDLFGELGVEIPEPEPEPEPAFAPEPDPMALDLPEPEPEPEPEPAYARGRHEQEEEDDLHLSLPETPAYEPQEEEIPAAFSDEGGLEDLVGGHARPSSSGDGDVGVDLGGLFDMQSAVEEEPISGGRSSLGDSGLAEIFKEFKAGVDRQLGKEDYDTRYNLGIAYKEMGLVDEAIAEFQLAAKDEARLLECSSMLGLCFMEKGMPKLAVKWFEKGLKAPGRTDEEYLGLRYDLASAYEAAGDSRLALGMFTDLYGQNANFRDVAEKVRQLGGRA